MRKSLALFVLTALALPAGLYAEDRYDFRQGTVLSVDKYEAPSTYLGNPSDAPLQSTEYDDDVALQVGCNVYVGRYVSAIDYVPPIFTANHAVDVRRQKHVMYVQLPGDREVKMGIVTNRQVKRGVCK